MDKIIDILDSIAYEKGLKIDDVENALKEALIKTAQKMVDETLTFDANIDRANKKLELFQKIEVVAEDDERLLANAVNKYGDAINYENFITLEEAKEIDPDLEIGDFMNYDLEFENMGRNAATILHSNFEYRLQRFIEENIVSKYKDKIGKTVSGTVTRIDKSDNTYIEIGEVKGILQRKSRIKGETFKVGDVVKLSGDANYAGNVTITGVDSLTVFNFTTAAAGNMTAAATQSATVIVDCTKNWTINEHVGKILQTHLVGTAGIVQPRVIVSNTATTITVATITTALVNGTGRYVIVDSSMFGRDEQYKVEAKKNVGMATGGSTTTLVDSTKYWDTNQWVGARIRIKSGTGRDAYFTITSNTATTLTYAAQTFTPDVTTNYIIQDTFGVCTGAGSTTTIVDSTKTWAVNQWAGKKVRLTGGAGFGLTAAANEVLIVSNTANTLTFTAITGLAPDATTTYTILGIPNRGVGIELIWLFGGISAGKRMIVARGSGSNTADMYDVSKEVWEYSMYFNPQMELMNAGTYYAYDGVDGVYFAPSTGTNTVQYIQKFDIKTSRIVGLGSIPTLQGAMVAGNRMEIIKSPSGISYLYVNKNSSTELLRVPIWF